MGRHIDSYATLVGWRSVAGPDLPGWSSAASLRYS
jgi:hypothetical protein